MNRMKPNAPRIASFLTGWCSVPLVALLCVLSFLSAHTHAQDSPSAERFKQLSRKAQAGEALTADEKAFLDRVRADIQKRRGQSGAPAPMQRPTERAAAAAGTWEELPDGSLGQETEFLGVGGVAIPAYVRKPKSAPSSSTFRSTRRTRPSRRRLTTSRISTRSCGPGCTTSTASMPRW